MDVVHLWSLREDVQLTTTDSGDVVLRGRTGSTRVPAPTPVMATALQRMCLGPVLLRNLPFAADPELRAVQEADVDAMLTHLQGFVVRTLRDSEHASPMMSLVPRSAQARLGDAVIPAHRRVRLARTGVQHRLAGDGLRLESPLSEFEVTVHHPDVAALVGRLHVAARAEELAAAAGLPEALVDAILGMLHATGLLAVADRSGILVEPGDHVPMFWSTWAQLTHVESSADRAADEPAGRRAPRPGPASDPPTRSAQLDLTTLATVLDDLRRRTASEPDGPFAELGLWLSVADCVGLAPGSYRVDTGRPVHLGGDTDAARRLRAAAAAVTHHPGRVPVLLCVTSRFSEIRAERTGAAYAVTLRNTGRLLQLAARTARDHRVRAAVVNAHFVDLAARVLDLDWVTESMVGGVVLAGDGVLANRPVVGGNSR